MKASDKEIVSKILSKYIKRIVNSKHFIDLLHIRDWPYQEKEGGIYYKKPEDFANPKDFKVHMLITIEGIDLDEYANGALLVHGIDFNVSGHPLFDENGFFRSLNVLRYVIDSEIKFWESFLTGEQDAEHWYRTLGLIKTPPDKIDSVIEMLESHKTFCDDLGKICKICVRNGANEKFVFELALKYFLEEGHKIINQAIKDEVNKVYHKIDLFLPPDVERDADATIRKYLEIVPSSEINVADISYLLSRFKLVIDNKTLDEKLAKIQEDVELDEFEEKLDKPYRSLPSNFEDLTGLEFENYLKLLFQLLGYDAVRTRSIGDQGADILLDKLEKRTVVQVKKYANPVDNTAIQQVVASKAYYKADDAMVVTNSTFTRSAIELAKSNNVVLIDGDELISMVKKVENKAAVSQSDLSSEIVQWVTREQLISDLIYDYEKFSEMKLFNVIDEDIISYVDEFDKLLIDYLQKIAPYLFSPQTICIAQGKEEELKKQIIDLENILDELWKMLLFVYHFKAMDLIKSRVKNGVDEAYKEVILSNLNLLQAAIYLAIFLTNLINLIKWLNDMGGRIVDDELIGERVSEIRLLVNRDLLNAIDKASRSYEIIVKRLEEFNLKDS